MKRLTLATTILFFLTAGSAWGSERDLQNFVAVQESLVDVAISTEERQAAFSELDRLSLAAGTTIEQKRKEAQSRLRQKYDDKIFRVEKEFQTAMRNRLKRLLAWYENHPQERDLYLERRKRIRENLLVWLEERETAIGIWFFYARENLLVRFENRYEQMLLWTDRGSVAIESRPTAS